MKPVFISLLLFFLVVSSSFSQDCTPQGEYFKARMILVDSVGVDYIYSDGIIKTMYKFEIDKLFGGEYNCTYVYVVTYGEDIYQFNPFKNKGKEYWWGMIYLHDKRDEIPVYRHGSNF